MLRSSLLSASVVLLCCASTASAQQQQIQARKLLSAPRDAGIYHVVTGTWTRNSGSSANLGPDIIYRNDASSGYFGTGWESAQGVDEGILPGPGNPFVGSQNFYEINGLSFGYCALGVGPNIVWELELYDSYVSCDDPSFPSNCIKSAWTLNTGNLPANSACWIVTFDLMGGAEACLEADGGTCAPGYDGGGIGIDGFGFGQSWLNGGTVAGPFLDGDPNWSPRGEGTCYNAGFTCGLSATALGEQDQFGIGTNVLNPGVGNGCFWFGGYNNTNGCGGPSQNPTGSMNLILFTDCTQNCDPDTCETIICDTDPNNVANATVNNDCDSAGGLILFMSNATPNKGTYPLISTGVANIVNPPGATGTLCVGGTIGRYSQDIQAITGAGDAQLDLMNATTGGGNGGIPNNGGNLVGSSWNCQWWYRHQNVAGGSRFSTMVAFGPVL